MLKGCSYGEQMCWVTGGKRVRQFEYVAQIVQSSRQLKDREVEGDTKEENALSRLFSSKVGKVSFVEVTSIVQSSVPLSSSMSASVRQRYVDIVVRLCNQMRT